jgi:hypothetical protein
MQHCTSLTELTVVECTRLSATLTEEIGRRYPRKLFG